MVSEYDLFPTVLDYIGLENLKIANTPGKSYAPKLKGEKLDWSGRDAVFFEEEQTRAIRTDKWMFCLRFPGLGPEELYDMKSDPEQRKNLAEDKKYAGVKKQLKDRLMAFFDKYADPKYDTWKGGTVKSNTGFPRWGLVWPHWGAEVKKVTNPFSDL